MNHRVASVLETQVCRHLRLWLETKATDSSDFRGVSSALEYFIPALLREHCAEWPAHESLDGIVPIGTKLVPDFGLELIGTAILMSDQTETPIRVRLRAHPLEDELDALACHLGEVDDTTGELVRVPYGSSAFRQALADRLDSVVWMYTVEITDTVRAFCSSTKQCDECGSLYFTASAAMASLCPECAHQLYDYERCDHEFHGSHCSKCFWDGSVSEYLARRD